MNKLKNKAKCSTNYKDEDSEMNTGKNYVTLERLRTANVQVLKIILFALTLCALPAVGLTEVEIIELHTFESVTLTDQEFLQGRKNAKPVTLSAELRLPRQKNKSYPAVVLIHGSGGISGYVDDWAQELTAMGIAVFIVDSFTARGLHKVNNDQSQLGRLAMIVDVYQALGLLSQDKRIDNQRIALMGFSRGGQVTLYAGLKRFYQLHGPGSGAEYSAYLAFYPACNTRYKHEEDVVNKPIRIFHGSADNYNPVAPCRNYVNRLKTNGKDIVLHEFVGAHHVFDYKKLVKPIVLAKAQTTRSFALEEADHGVIANSKTRQPFTYQDPCVEHGPTIAFNEKAYRQARQELQRFISRSSIFANANEQLNNTAVSKCTPN
jgi:dienelactone hydrolase